MARNKARLIMRTESGEVILDLMVEAGSTSTIVLPDDHGLTVASLVEQPMRGPS